RMSLKDPEAAGVKIKYKFGEKGEDILDGFNDNFMDYIENNLKNFDPDKLTDNQRRMYKLLEYELKMYKESESEGEYIASFFSQNNSYISTIQFYFTEFPIDDESDVELYLDSLKRLPDYLKNQEDEIGNKIVKDNLLFTKEMYNAAIDFGEDWLASEPEKEILYVAFKNSIEKTEIPEDKQKEYLSELAGIIEESTMPAIERYIKFVKSFKKYIDESKGLCNFDGGKEYYATLLEEYIGMGTTVDEFYEYLEDKTMEYWDKMIEIISDDYSLVYSYTDAESKYGDDPDKILEALKKLSEKILSDTGDSEWIVSYLAEEQENDVVAAYYISPPLDDINKRVIRVNGNKVEDTVDLFVTLAHEGIPGHLYQDEYRFAQDDFQEMNQMLTYLGVQEGWAMFVEKQAFFWCIDDEKVAELRYREAMLNYLVEALCDIRVNYYGDTVNELKQYLNDNFYLGSSAKAIYEVVVSDPCLFPAYGGGFILMEDTFDALIDKGYSESEAYKKIIEVGNAPFTILWDEIGLKNVITGK
ncbi:MAG: DUF885 family protein, partial [Lachnospiraceae bacterium]|nr:DUF885 family protein [Lachnospiraceae bacterium]